jgi:stromal membrane-associated protein
MAAAAATEQAKLKKRLELILKRPENQICCDCGRRGPRWASANLGNFFCIECSGIHRNLGVHISFVRSVNLDTWTEKQVQFMEQWGNARANAYYEANLPAHVQKPNQNDAVRVVEKFIRDKYEHKKYIAASMPPPVVHKEPEHHGHGHGHGKHHHGHHAHNNSEHHKAPATAAPRQTLAPVSVAVPVTKPAASEPNLLDFDAPVAPSPSSVFGFASATSAPPVVHSAPSHAGDGFGEFNAAPNHFQPQFSDPFAAPQQQQQTPDMFGGFAGHAPQQQHAPAAPPKPQASADAILSLYATGPGMGGHHMQPPQQQYHHHQQQQQFPHGAYPPQQFAPGGFPPQQFPPHVGYPQQQQYGYGMAQAQHYPPYGGAGGMPMGGQSGYPPMGGAPQGYYPQQSAGWQQAPPAGQSHWQQAPQRF